MRIVLGDTKRLGHNPNQSPCKTGSKLGGPYGKYGRGNLTIMVQGISMSKTFINKDIFKQALLQNKEFIKEQLNVEIKDLSVQEPVVVKKPKPVKEVEPPLDLPKDMPMSYEDMTVADLKELCKMSNIEYTSKMKKQELIDLLRTEE